MKKENLIYCLFLLFMFPSALSAQEYCMAFSKEKRNIEIVEEGSKISFLLPNDEKWRKGVVTKITSEKVFIDESKNDKAEVNSYALADFNRIAYPKISSAAVGTSIMVLLAATAVAAACVDAGASAGAGLATVDTDGVGRKIFQKNIDFDDGWQVQIVPHLTE